MAEIERNRNFSLTATVTTGIVLNAATSTVIASANLRRIFFHVDNNRNNVGAWIKLQAALVDNIQKGIFLARKAEGQMFWEMSRDNMYLGEISAIADSGNPVIYVTEY